MKHTLISIAVAAAIAASCQGAPAQVLVGQTIGVTGPAAASIAENIFGAQLAIDDANAHGGAHGEKIEVLRMDDGYDVKRAGENARILIEDKKVVAMFMNRGTPHAQAIIPWATKYGVPFVAPGTGAMVLHRPVQRYVFNVRAPYQREAEKAIKHLLTVGVNRIAIVHVNDTFGQDALAGAQAGFDKEAARPVIVIPADRDRPDYSSIVPAIAAARAQAVLWVGSSMAVAEGIKALRKAGSAAQVVTLSNNASSGFINLLGDKSSGVIVTQVFPSERSVANPMVSEALKLARAKGQQELSPAMLEGYAAGKVLVEALRRAGPKPTRAKVLTALEGLRDYDLGNFLTVSYSRQDHSGIDFADLSIISEGRFKR